MGKPQSRQPADGARARRRSLVELTAAMSRDIGIFSNETDPSLSDIKIISERKEINSGHIDGRRYAGTR